MFPCFVLPQFCSVPTWSLEGAKRLSIFISGLDLFWAVIKVHLPLRISIMMSLTLVYMEAHGLAGLTCTSLIKSAELWIYSKACMINEGKDLVQYCRLFHNFTTHSFPLTRVRWCGAGWVEAGTFPYGVATVSGCDSCLCSSCWGVARTEAEAVPCIDNCAFVWRWGGLRTPDTPPSGSVSVTKRGLVVYLGLTDTF